MRIVFCGSGGFGVPSLRAVLAAGYEVPAVVTQPARPAGRGGHVRSTPLAQAAGELGVGVLELEKINKPESVAAIAALKPDVIWVVDFGQMVRAQVRDLAPLGAYNLHGSLLPQLRGAAPVNWAIIRGLSETGVTTFRLVDAMDAGDMFVRKATPISPAATADELRACLSELGAQATVETLAMLAEGKTQGQAQDESKVTLAPRLTKADGVIDWSADAVSIRNRIHGTWRWPGAQAVFTSAQGKVVHVEIARAEVVEQAQASAVVAPLGAAAVAAAPGTLLGDLTIATVSGRLKILQLQPSGKRLMEWKDFVNGYRVAPGDHFARTELPS